MKILRTSTELLKRIISHRSLAFAIAGSVFLLALLTNCKLFSAGLGSKVDLEPPSLVIITPSANAYIASNLVVSGQSSDDVGLKEVAAAVTDAGTGRVVSLTTAVQEDGTWTLSFPVVRSGPAATEVANGEQLVEITATDVNGKITKKNVVVYVDTIAPTAVVSVPASYDASSPDGIVTSTYLSVKGETWDASGVSSVSVSVLKTDGTVLATKTADGTATWSARFVYGTDVNLANGTYDFAVTATDKAGNVSTRFYHENDIRDHLDTGLLLPAIDDIGRLDQLNTAIAGLDSTVLETHQLTSIGFTVDADTNKPTISFSNLDPDAPLLENVLPAQMVVAGFVEDDKEGVDSTSISASLKLEDDSTVALSPTQIKSIGDGLTVNFQFALESGGTTFSNGRYRITVTAADKGGASRSVSADFIIDSSWPTIADILPQSGSFVTVADGKISVQASISDDNPLPQATPPTVARLEDDDSVAYSESMVNTAGDTWAGSVTVPDGAVSARIRITAIDDSGKQSVSTVVYDIDTAAPTVVITRPSSGAAVEGDALYATGSAEDAGSGIQDVIWALVSNTGGAAAEPESASSEWKSANLSKSGDQFIWTATTDFPDGTEGLFSLFVKAVDYAGNTSATTRTDFAYDRAAPTITETAIGTSVTVNQKTGFSFSGTAADTNGLAGLTVTQNKDGGGAVVVSGTGLTGTTDWSLSGLPRDPASTGTTVSGSAADGEYEYILTAADIAGKTTALTRRIRFDATGPVVTVVNPAEDSWSSSASVTVNGTASDLTGVRAVYYSTAASEPALPSDPTTDANWTGAGWTKTSGTTGWTVSFSGLSEGTKIFRSRAVDTTGNVSDVAVRNYGVDLAVPVLSCSTPSTNTNAGFSLSGTASDTNALAAAALTVTQQKDGGSAVVVTLNPPTTSDSWANWSLGNLPRNPSSIGAQLIGAAADGLYEYVVTATDAAGKTTSATRTVRYDATAAVATITSPADGEVVGGTSYAFSGSASDTGSGLKRVHYSFTNDGSDWLEAAGAWTATVALASLGAEGPKTIYVMTEDNAGNLSADGAYARSFVYDTAAPLLSVSGSANREVKEGFILSGTASDGYGVANVRAWQTKNSGAKVEINTAGPTGPDGTSGTAAWTLADLPRDPSNIGTQLLTDGLYEYEISATDNAGKTSLFSAITVRVDSTAPETNAINYPGTDQIGANAISGSAYTFKGFASDAGVGVARVYYLLDHTAIASVDTADYSTLATSGSWSFTEDLDYDGTGADTGLSEGRWYLHVIAEDSSGNQTTATTVMFDIDQAAPTASETYVGSDSTMTEAAAGFEIRGNAQDTNGLASIAVRQKRNDDAYVSIYSAALSGASAAWTLASLPRNTAVPTDLLSGAAADGIYTYEIIATDAAGRTSPPVYRIVTYDAGLPTVTVDTPQNGAVVSSATLTIAGTASDGTGSGIAAVYYSLDGTDPDETTGTLSGTTIWNKSIDLGAEGPKTLKLRAKDRFGHYSEITTVGLSLDLTPPTLNETTIGAGTKRRSDDFQLSGTASDTNGLKTWDHDGDSGTAEVPYIEITVDGATSKVNVDSNDNTWTFSYLVPTDGSKDGDHSFTITATDIVDKQTVATRTVTVDSTKPTITLEGVVTGINSTTNEVNGIATIRFNANDAGVGIEKVTVDGQSVYRAFYQLIPADTAVSASAGAMTDTDPQNPWKIITSSSSSFSFPLDTSDYGLNGAENMNLWIGILDAVDDPLNGPNFQVLEYYDSKYASDDPSYHYLTVNQESDKPVITVESLNESAATNDENVLDQNPTIFVTIEDDDAVDVSTLRYRIDINNDGDFNGATDPTDRLDFWDGNTYPHVPDGDTDDKWENDSVWYSFAPTPDTDVSSIRAKILLTNFPQGSYRIQIEAKDTVGGTYSTTQTSVIPFAVDYGPPVVSLSSPSSGTYKTDLNLSGSVSDGLGVVTVKYSLNGGSTYTTLFSDAAGALSVPLSATIPSAALGTGEYVFQLVATDKRGYTATQQIPFTMDMSPPTATILQPASGATLNGTDVTVSGEAQDNRIVNAVYLWHGLAYPAEADPVFPDDYGLPLSGKGVWTTTIDTTAKAPVSTAANGYRIRVVAVDDLGNAGIPTERFVTVDQNGDRPAIAFSNLDLDVPSRLGTGARIIGTVEDDDGVDKDYLQIRADYNGDGDYLDANEDWKWISNRPTASAQTVSWYHVLYPNPNDETQGKKHIQVRALDIKTAAANKDVFTAFGDSAGLSGYTWRESASIEFYIDYGPPSLSLTAPVSGTKYNTNQFAVSGTTNDGNGVDRVTIWTDNNGDQIKDTGEEIVIGWYDANSDGIRDSGEIGPLGTNTATGPITIDDTTYAISQTVSGLSDGVKNVQIVSYDTADAPSTRDLTVVIDTTPPTASINTPSAGATLNGMVTVSGLASDSYQLANVYYSILKSTDSAPAYPAGYTALNQTYAWSVPWNTAEKDIDENSIYPDGTYIIRILPLDSAGNYPKVSAVDPTPVPITRTIIVDQTSDRPRIQVTSVSETGTAIANLLPGDKVISGTVQDDDGVKGASVQVAVISPTAAASLTSGKQYQIASIGTTDFTLLGAASNTVGLVFTKNATAGAGTGTAVKLPEAADWTNATNPPADGTAEVPSTWRHTVSASDGIYYLWSRAYDINSSDYSGFGSEYRFEDFLTDNGGIADGNEENGVVFAIDTANPTVTVSGPAQNFFSNGNEDKNADGILGASEDDDGNTLLDAAGRIVFRGTSWDASGVKSVAVEYRLQGDADYTALSVSGTDTWSALLSTAALADGVYDWRVSVTDNFDKTSIVDRLFTLDKTAPSVSILNPGVDSTVNGSLYIDGSATDKWKTTEDGFQITSVRVWIGQWTGGPLTEPTPPAVTSFYARTDSTNLKHDATHWKELTGTNSWNYRFNTTSVADGTYSVFLTAVDNSGNVSSIISRRIYVDQTTNLPTVSMTTMISGHYEGTIEAGSTVTTFSDAALSGASVDGSWYVRFRSNGTIRKVASFSGTTVTFSPKLESAPSGDYDLVPNLLNYPSSAEGEISDDDGVNASSVMIAVDANGDGVFSGAAEDFVAVDSTTVSGGKVVFSHNIGSRYVQGLSVYRLKVKASDIGEDYAADVDDVASVTRTTAEYVFVRDDAAPASATLSSFDNGTTDKTSGISGANFKDYFSISGVAADTVGVGEVEVAIGAASNFSSGVPLDFAPASIVSRNAASTAWTFTNASVGALEGEITVRVKTTDLVGKLTTESFTFFVDRTGPTVAFSNPAAGSLHNGNLTVSGTAGDTYQVSSVRLWIGTGTSPVPPDISSFYARTDTADPTHDATHWKETDGTTSWTYDYDTSSLPYGTYTIFAAAYDNAGNLSANATRTVVLDQGTNRPSITATGFRSSSIIGTMTASATTYFSDTRLKNNTDVKIGWTLAFPDGSTRTVSAFDPATGRVTWSGALAAAFPVGSSYTLEAPWYTVTAQTADSITVSALSDASRGSVPAPTAGMAALIELSSGVNVTSLVTSFSDGTLGLQSVPSGVLDGATRVKILPLALVDSVASLNGTVVDDDGPDSAAIQVSIDLNNDGDYDDAGEGYQTVDATTGVGTSISFTHDLSGLSEGTTIYKLRIKAADVGESAYGVAAVERESAEYLFAKDDDAPDAALLASFSNKYYGASGAVSAKTSGISGSYIANGDTITLAGTASDTVGVASVSVSVDGGATWLAAAGTVSWTWSYAFSGKTDGATVPFIVRTTDYWGRTSLASFNFKADSTVPTAAFAAFGRKLNGAETLQGTAGDLDSNVAAVYFNKTITDSNTDGTPDALPAFNPSDPTANGWTLLGGTANWNASLTTTALNDTNTDVAIRIAVAAADEAGNAYSFERVETINQDADRPVITFSNIGMTSAGSANRFDANPRIIGTASDDDGVSASKVLASLDGSAYVLVTNPPTADGTAGGVVTWSHELTDITGTVPGGATATGFTDGNLTGKTQIVPASWQIVLSVSGASVVRSVASFDSATGAIGFADAGGAPSGSYTLRLVEGPHTVSVRVGDIGSGADSVRTNSFRWEQSDGDATALWQDDPTDFTYDTGAPEVAFTRLQMADRYTGTYTSGRWLDISSENAMIAVSLNNDWTLSGTAIDGSLQTVTVQVDSGSVTDLGAVSSWSHNFTWLSAPPGGFAQGSHTVKITATDNFGKSTVKTLSVVLDTAEPVLTLSSPTDSNADFAFDASVNGTVYMNGTLNEAAVVSIGTGNAYDQMTYTTSPTAVANWSYSFNSANLRSSAYATFAGGDDGSGGGTAGNGIEDGSEVFVYVSKVKITATDPAGNVSEAVYTFTIDNNTDRPQTSVILPADGAYQSGVVLVSGLCSDDAQTDDGVHSVWVQIDANGDGNFADSHAFPSSATGNTNAGDDPYEDETLWYKVPTAQLVNGAAWTLNINGNGTLYAAPSPYYSADYATGLTPVAITAGRLYASKTGYSGMIKIRTVAVDKHGVIGVPSAPTTVFLDESYPSVGGVLVNGTDHVPGVSTLSSGIVKLAALFTDDQKLTASNIEIKYNQTDYAVVAASNIVGPFDWDGDGRADTAALTADNSTAVSGVSTAATTTSLTAAGLGSLASGEGLYVLYTAAGSRSITTDGSTTVTWSGDLAGLSAAENFIIAEPFAIDTQATVGGIDYANNEGELTVVLRVTDETNQSASTTVEYAVDNKRPSGVFNYNASLTYSGADAQTGLYTFRGNDQTANLLIGSMSDSGTISGIKQVSLYFFKDQNGNGSYDAGTDKFWSPRSDDTDATFAGGSDEATLFPTGGSSANTIPYPSDASYVIVVDKRTENLIYNTDANFGDNDDFQESLLAKAGYDEWKVLFDTTKLPDGPIWIFAVYEDDAGNRSYQRINAQISNNPPTISSFVLGGSTYSGSTTKVKTSGALTIGINSTDVEGIDPAGYELNVAQRYTDAYGTVADTTFTAFSFGIGGLADFYEKNPAAAAPGASYAEIALPLLKFTKTLATGTYTSLSDAGLVDSVDYTGWYLYLKDTVGSSHMVRALSSFNRTTGTATFASASLANDYSAELVYRAGTLDSGTTSTMADDALIGQPSLKGLRVLFEDETTELHYITDYDSATGTVTFSTARGSAPSGTYRIYPYFENLWFKLTATVSDTDGSSVSKDFYLKVNNEDSTPPNVAIDDFTQAHLVAGHLEAAGQSLHDGTDADISGTLNLTGTASDDSAVTSVELSFDGGSTWNAAALVNTYTDPEGVQPSTYTWSYAAWDSSSISVVAQDNFSIQVRAYDGVSNQGTNSKTVDVVPYITDITTGLEGGLKTYIKRSVQGHYVIRTGGSAFIVKGYNFGPSATMTVGSSSAAISGRTGTTQITVTNNLTESGEVTVTTGAVSSTNNVNDDTLSQNKETTTYYPDRTDNRSIKFWQLDSHNTTAYQGVTDAVMKPNNAAEASASNFDWMYVKNGQDLYQYQGSSAGTRKITGSTSLNGGDFGYNSDGSLIFLFNHNNQWTTYANDYRFVGSIQWGAIPTTLAGWTFTATRDEAYNWNRDVTASDFPRLGLGNLSFIDGGSTTVDPWYSYSALAMWRYKNPRMVTLGSNTANRNYVVYFDSGAGESRGIVYYGFKSGSAPTATSSTYYHGTGTSAGTVALGAGWKATIDKFYNCADTATVALAGTAKNNDMGLAAPRGRMEVTGTNTTANSEYFDFGVHVADSTTPTHYGFIVYYDETARQLKLRYKTDLATADAMATGNAWSSAYVLDGSGTSTPINNTVGVLSSAAGSYVAMAVEPAGGATDTTASLHIAYQDVDLGYLKYIHVVFDGSGGTVTVDKRVFVDALIASGLYNAITVKDFGSGDYRPVITTYSSALISSGYPLRVSYPLYALSSGSFGAGANADTGAFTGKWETIAVVGATTPQSLKPGVFITGSGYSAGSDKIHLGYNGSYLEEATLLE